MLPIHTVQGFDNGSTVTIHGYRISHWRHGERGRILVRDRAGRVVANLSDFDAQWAEDWGPHDLDGDGSPEALLTTWSGGIHGSQGYYVVSLGRKFKCLLAYWKGNSEDWETDLKIQDLDHDGTPELVSWYDGFAYRLGKGYCPLMTPLVFALKKGRYVEATGRFQDYVRGMARSALDSLQSRKPDPTFLVPLAVNFLADKMLLGEERNGWAVTRKLVSKSDFSDLWRHRYWIRKVLDDRKRRAAYPGDRVHTVRWTLGDQLSEW